MKIPYLDAHCDTVTRFKSLRECPDTHLDLTRVGKWSPAGQVIALFAPPGKDTEEDLERILSHAEPSAVVTALVTSSADTKMLPPETTVLP